MKTYVSVSLLLISFTLIATPVAAQEQKEPSDVAKAKALQVEGLKQLDKGNAAAALEKFSEAYELVPSAKVLFNQGRAYEALQKDIEALAAYENFLASPNMPAAAREDAQRRVQTLHTRLAFLAVTGPAGADVSLDGESKGKLPFDQEFAMTPGRHELRLQRDSQELHRQTLDARAGATINVNVVLQTQTTVREPSPFPTPQRVHAAPARQEVKAVAQAPEPQTQPSERQWMRPAVWGVGGVAVGALILGGVEQWLSARKTNEFNNYTQAPLTADGHCGTPAPQAGGGACQSFIDASNRAHNVAIGAFVAGGVLAATAATLYFLSPSTASVEPAMAFACIPSVGQFGAACSVRF